MDQAVGCGSSSSSSSSRTVFCPHCSQQLSSKTFKAHKRLYFDQETNEWHKKRRTEPAEDFADDILFSCFESDNSNVSGDESGNDGFLRETEDGDECSPATPCLGFCDHEPEEQGSSLDLPGGVPELQGEHTGTEEDVEVFEEDEDINMWEGDSESVKTTPLMLWLVFLIASVQRKHYIPDSAIAIFLQILYIFLQILSKAAPSLTEIANSFPSSVHKMQLFLDLNSSTFTKYVVCSKCSSVYTYAESIDKIGSRELSKRCRKCQTLLLRTVESPSGRRLLYPYRTYCYNSLKKSLQDVLSRPGFMNHCKLWLNRTSKENVYSDIYDGNIWKEFQHYEGKEMLSDSHTLGLMMNIDWFKPYKHVQYAVGAIYLSIMNLPRELRFKPENILLVGLIPGPREPQLDINAFLRPLVSELLELFDGVEMNVYDEGMTCKMRCLLLCVACDIPASRKVCGFLGHSANLGCSKCYKKFPGPFGCKDYSGFDRSSWVPRFGKKHRDDVKKICQTTSKAAKAKLESEMGCRYSVLLKLPYFDPVRMCPLDPMHNLFWGTSKNMMKLWIEKGLITAKDFDGIQDAVNNIHIPSSIGRIPSKIASSFSGLTADQLKNWTTLFSLMVLIDRFPKDDIECWRHFVLASRILCKPVLTLHDINLADALLLYFCKRVERLYGSSVITPNMHLHCHLKDSILDYGTVYSFWLFSFERFNGFLEHFPSNNRTIEISLMHRFLTEFKLDSVHLPDEHAEEFHSVFCSVANHALRGAVRETHHSAELLPTDLHCINDWTLQSAHVTFSKSFFRCCFSEQDLSDLRAMYTLIIPDEAESIELNSTYRKYYNITYKRNVYRTNTGFPLALAYSPSTGQPRSTTSTVSGKVCPVVFHYFAEHSVTYQSEVRTYCLAAVSWLKEHGMKDSLGKPLQLWWKDLYEDNLHFIPVQFFFGPCVHTDYVVEGQKVLLLSSIHHL